MTLATSPGALLIAVDGTATAVTLPDDNYERAAQILALIGCRMFTCVSLTDRIDMWLDDEGLYTQPYNPTATRLARRFGLTHQPYHGPAFITGGVDNAGDTLPLTPTQVDAITGALHEIRTQHGL